MLPWEKDETWLVMSVGIATSLVLLMWWTYQTDLVLEGQYLERIVCLFVCVTCVRGPLLNMLCKAVYDAKPALRNCVSIQPSLVDN